MMSSLSLSLHQLVALSQREVVLVICAALNHTNDMHFKSVVKGRNDRWTVDGLKDKTTFLVPLSAVVGIAEVKHIDSHDYVT